MELTQKEKDALIDSRVRTYKLRIYDAELNLAALRATNSSKEQIAAQEKNIAGLHAAIAAVEAMRGGDGDVSDS
ncbi:hypothetical protein DFQ01_14444 [Paenibacillus cellulosilyticus]|uniref:Uncharacterized protein n=1 Tax=Paenibacillus cellulosilyticus TaxID=375489 RepID=A0A2V2YGP0_9BACL|nr:hypothetical protein [Paenibacillus cellulosilyticus]PWV90268.1 hypothetical protein DFQ01_14444 [Paenibacillus cellulosilyticus]QKS43426.1 hypothetical protein HUB94_02575 [Paenibacillus cellulosilyticus]